MARIGVAYAPSFGPNGRRLAYISHETGAPQVFIAGLAGTDARQVTHFEDQVANVRWSPRGKVLAVAVAPGGGLNAQLYLVPPKGGEPRMITAGGKVNNWLGEWSEDGRYLSYASNVRGTGSMAAYLYDLEAGDSRLVAESEGLATVAALSPDAKRAVVWQMRSRGNTDLYLVDLDSGEEQLLTPHDGIALSEDACFVGTDTLLISTNVDRERMALARVQLDASGAASPMEIIAGRDDAEISGFDVHPNGEQAAIIWNVAGRSELAYIDLGTDSISPGPQLPAEIAGGMVYSSDGEHIAMTMSGAAEPHNVWVLDVGSGQFSRVSNSPHDGIDLGELVRPKLVHYSAHDGLQLTGWLYRPKDVSGPGPMVLSFHGGPEGQERPRFRTTYQALLARGIAVFGPNVRGSAGFGKTFVNLDNGALRFDAVKDIKATVDYVIGAGLAAPGQIGIMGASYGGYMVMAGLTEYPEAFAAGANLFGIVNFETFFANTEPWMAAISRVEYGDPETQASLLRELSPIHKVDRVIAPTIVLHGANDTNVPVVEAQQVVRSLEARDVPVKYVLFPDEGHGWKKTVNRITSDVEIVSWFDRYLKDERVTH